MAFKTTKTSFKDVSFPQERKQKMLFGALFTIVLLTLVVAYFAFWRPTPMPTEELTSASEQKSSEVKSAEDIDFNTDLLSNPLFEDLKLYYDEHSLKIEEKGRSQPFLPYQGQFNQDQLENEE